MAQDNRALNVRRNEVAVVEDVERALAELIRLRGWLTVIANCNSESSAEDRYARRIRYMARRALAGEAV